MREGVRETARTHKFRQQVPISDLKMDRYDECSLDLACPRSACCANWVIQHAIVFGLAIVYVYRVFRYARSREPVHCSVWEITHIHTLVKSRNFLLVLPAYHIAEGNWTPSESSTLAHIAQQDPMSQCVQGRLTCHWSLAQFMLSDER